MEALLHQQSIRPRYGGHCFADIPDTLRYWLTGSVQPGLDASVIGQFTGRYERVVFCLIDAFGWNFFQRFYDQSPLLQRFSRQGSISKLTSQFPSTTAAHVTSIHTGLPVAESGVYEWQYYEPILDAVITPLLFSLAGSMKRDTLKSRGIEAAKILPQQTIYQDLAIHGVRSTIFQNHLYTPSSYSDVVFRGAKTLPYRSLPEALSRISVQLKDRESSQYIFFYYDNIDATCHRYGPDGEETAAEITFLLSHLEKAFQKDGSKTLLILTADHGQVALDPEKTIYLNTDPQLSALLPWLETDRAGVLLPPGGSCRDVFLKVKKGSLERAQNLLKERLAGRADVVTLDVLIKEGFFGPDQVSEVLLGRAGNLVILPYPEENVWWYEQGRFEVRFKGMHGGLSPVEMEIPFALMEL